MIKHPKGFAEATPAGYDGLFDWDFLLPAFQGTNIEPMDLDGVIERRGKVLIFETKSLGKEIPLGQSITLEVLVQLGRGAIYIMIIYGKTVETIEAMEEWYYSSRRVIKTEKTPCNAQYILERVTAWFEWANKPAKERLI